MKDNLLSEFNEKLYKVGFNFVIQLAFTVILVFIMISILIGIYRLFGQIGILVDHKGITGSYLTIITDVLTLFIMVELSRFLIDYFESAHLRITYLVDAVIVFVLREILVQLFQHKLEAEMVYSLSAFLLVLTVLRLGSLFIKVRYPESSVAGSVSIAGGET